MMKIICAIINDKPTGKEQRRIGVRDEKATSMNHMIYPPTLPWTLEGITGYVARCYEMNPDKVKSTPAVEQYFLKKTP